MAVLFVKSKTLPVMDAFVHLVKKFWDLPLTLSTKKEKKKSKKVLVEYQDWEVKYSWEKIKLRGDRF